MMKEERLSLSLSYHSKEQHDEMRGGPVSSMITRKARMMTTQDVLVLFQ
jgi:hypothetical protein